jgi:hypothetical protein
MKNLHGQVYITRNNLLKLLNGLDRVADGEQHGAQCTIIKRNYKSEEDGQIIYITALEDKDFYKD